MSTPIPFTVVEGAVALPSLRPLGPLSQSFGHEWALLPPNVSLRAELKALYAAMLRTFCLSSQAIRSMCKWEPLNVAGAANLVSARAADGASNAGSAAVAAGVSAGSTRMTRPAAHTPQRASNLRLGSAVAIGGAAVLAWIVLDHPHRQPAANQVATRNSTSASQAVQIEPPRAAATASASSKSGDGASVEKAPDGNSPDGALQNGASTNTSAALALAAHAAATLPSDSGTAPSTAKTPALATLNPSAQLAQAPAPVPQQTSNTSAHTPAAHAVSNAAIPVFANTPRQGTPSVVDASNAFTLRHIASSHDMAPAAARRVHPRTSTRMAHDATLPVQAIASRAAAADAKPSMAGDYSPSTPTPLTVSEYESVTLSARTHSAIAASPERAQRTADTTASANDTSWMNRMTQRRVTEVPELFSR
ncbi:hypothetical protein [Paraburkholderia solisilvae]|uniref:Uncharacterized protein n=1 Tax=Paraburkholderia solisilvae TaxID=624376 RepID=A0A6J5EC61_9BURK|nr:hypothetical protein [Paraburkholderia solisilvae]CAB3763833.1 hypothetical protein LMG29739_04202 [Paraburkholderia solisilvae]